MTFVVIQESLTKDDTPFSRRVMSGPYLTKDIAELDQKIWASTMPRSTNKIKYLYKVEENT